jgi:hypothetical protein
MGSMPSDQTSADANMMETGMGIHLLFLQGMKATRTNLPAMKSWKKSGTTFRKVNYTQIPQLELSYG